MEKIIIYGAGKTGERAYENLRNSKRILFFVDKDCQKQGSGKCKGLDVYPPDKLSEYINTKVVIASAHYIEILNEIQTFSLNDISIFQEHLLRVVNADVQEQLNHRTIDLGSLLFKQKSMNVGELTFIPGGSGVLDYVLIKIIAKMFEKKTYLEIGTYIGESINIMSEVCEKLYSVTAPIDSNYGMRNWCKCCNIPHHSGKLVDSARVITFYTDSKKFDFSRVGGEVDIYFVDGDHSYSGVFHDTRNIFLNRKDDSIIIWHDFKGSRHEYNGEVVSAVRDAIGEEFRNVFVFNNNICGIYLPEQYQGCFGLREEKYEENSPLYTYEINISRISKK